MYQRKSEQPSQTRTGWISCSHPRCHHSTNDPNVTICESCKRSLLVQPDLKIVGKNKPFTQLTKNQKTKPNRGQKIKTFSIGLGALALLSGGIFAYQVKASSPEAVLKRSRGTILFGGEPCAQGLINHKIANKIENLNKDLKFLYRDNDRNRDQVWEVINKGIDIGFTEQTLDKHSEYAKSRGVKLYIENYADDIIAFVTNKNIQSRPLRVKELENIYEGKIIDWRQFSEDGKIIPIEKLEKGKEQKIITILVKGEWRNPNGLRLDDGTNPNTILVESPEEGKAVLFKTKNAIFYTSATLAARELHKLNIIDIINNEGQVVKPVLGQEITNLKALYNGDYPLVRNLQLVVNNKILTTAESELTTRQKAIKAFVRYTLSPEGQRLVEHRGFGARYEVAQEKSNKFSFLPWF